MKKFGLALILALAVVFAVSTSAFAALSLDPAATANDGKSDYLSPTTPYIPGNPATNPIHSNYQKNTDACAACHSAHNGVGADLLQWSSPTAACEACHDGTLTSTYDVQHGAIGTVPTATKMTFGGLFGDLTPTNDSNAATSWSKHSVGAVNINAAPGGPGAGQVTGDVYGNDWGTTFECTSCHDPHSTGGNYRALNPNANGYAEAHYEAAKVLTTSDNLTFASGDALWMNAYPLKPTIFVDGTKVTSGYTINASSGSVTFSSSQAGHTVTANVYPGLKVVGSISGKLTVNEQVYYGNSSATVSGINGFCGACHDDYDTENVNNSAGVLSGKYHEAYRHKVGYQWHGAVPGLMFATDTTGSNEVTCLTCHVAHGTNDTWWGVWKSNTGWTGTLTGSQDELDGVSALKRLPNMSMCEACHNK